MNSIEQKLESFRRLLVIMDELRDKCPWDKKQTLTSLRNLTIEEVYELAQAIQDQDNEELKKELGDVLLHIVFYAKIASETQLFDISDVIESLCDKLVYRHPHIYGDVQVSSEQEVKANWEALKLKEKKNKGVLSGVPKALPSLIKAYRIQQKAASVGFDWDNAQQVKEKVSEELQELEQEVVNQDHQKMTDEFGDVLFAMINYGRHLNIDPQEALERTNKKFINRFNYLENQVAKREVNSIQELSLEQLDVYWEEAKKELK